MRVPIQAGWFGLLLCALCMSLPAWAQVAPPFVSEAPPAATANDDGNSINSLFFPPEDMKRVRMALAMYDPNMVLSAGTPAAADGLLIGKKDGAALAYSYPQFFLQSLVYYSPNDWFIWVNDQKITSATLPSPSAIFHVSAITGSQVTLTWIPQVMSKVNAVWDAMATHPDPAIRVDKTAGLVEFTLRPNQTFSSYGMRILEGKVVPVSENGNAVDSIKKADKISDKPPVPAAPSDNKQGLDGLINSYQQLGPKS